MIYNVAEATSYEVRAHWNKYSQEGDYQAFIGLSCFSPVINIMRHPLWGRNQVIRPRPIILPIMYSLIFCSGTVVVGILSVSLKSIGFKSRLIQNDISVFIFQMFRLVVFG